jgi:hypothetical protein
MVNINIYFTCPWEKTENLSSKLIKNTPFNKGVWKNIEYSNDINKCDFLIVLDDLHISLLNNGIEHFISIIKDHNKIIYFQRENTSILKKCTKSWFQLKILPILKHNYSYEDNFFYTFTTANFLNKTYDELKSMEYPYKTKKISCIISNKKIGKTYEDRVNFITEYSNKYQDTIDIFGKGWNNELGINYKGELGSYHQENNINTSKFDGLYNYNYSICLENYPNENVLSEKITDCLLSWCMPIYYGPPCTSKYYPNDAYYLIDINDKNIYDKIKKITYQNLTQKNIEAIRESRNLILDKYNIWEQIYQIIEDTIKFKVNYNYKLTIYFCHYPKTGGTYIKNLIYNTYNGIDIINNSIINNSIIAKQFNDKNINIIILDHDLNYGLYKKNNNILITNIRNPLTLIESYYSHGQLGFGNILKNTMIKSFNDFLNIFINNNPYFRFEDNYFYKNFFINKTPIFDIVFKLENIENDFKKFLISCDINYENVNFKLDDYNKNSYNYENWIDKEKRNHKKERKNGFNVNKDIKLLLYNKYKFFFDYYNYSIN